MRLNGFLVALGSVAGIITTLTTLQGANASVIPQTASTPEDTATTYSVGQPRDGNLVSRGRGRPPPKTPTTKTSPDTPSFNDVISQGIQQPSESESQPPATSSAPVVVFDVET